MQKLHLPLSMTKMEGASANINLDETLASLLAEQNLFAVVPNFFQQHPSAVTLHA